MRWFCPPGNWWRSDAQAWGNARAWGWSSRRSRWHGEFRARARATSFRHCGSPTAWWGLRRGLAGEDATGFEVAGRRQGQHRKAWCQTQSRWLHEEAGCFEEGWPEGESQGCPPKASPKATAKKAGQILFLWFMSSQVVYYFAMIFLVYHGGGEEALEVNQKVEDDPLMCLFEGLPSDEMILNSSSYSEASTWLKQITVCFLTCMMSGCEHVYHVQLWYKRQSGRAVSPLYRMSITSGVTAQWGRNWSIYISKLFCYDDIVWAPR